MEILAEVVRISKWKDHLVGQERIVSYYHVIQTRIDVFSIFQEEEEEMKQENEIEDSYTSEKDVNSINIKFRNFKSLLIFSPEEVVHQRELRRT